MKSLLFLLLSIITCQLSIVNAQTPNERQAREIFDKTWELVYGEQGSTFHYDVNIIGIYKTSGTVWQKGKKNKYQSSHSTAWNNGTSCYVVRKKEVTIYRSDDPDRDKHASRFQFDRDNYKYSIANDKDGIMLTLKPKSSRVKGVSEVKLLVDRHTFVPIRLKVKVSIIHANVRISNFRSGNISDETFEFPAEKYKSLKVVDKR